MYTSTVLRTMTTLMLILSLKTSVLHAAAFEAGKSDERVPAGGSSVDATIPRTDEPASACGSGSAEAAASTPSFTIVGEKTFADDVYGPGYPITYRALTILPSIRLSRPEGAYCYGQFYRWHGEFSQLFVDAAIKDGAHTLEIGFGDGTHVQRILEVGKGKTFTLSLNEISQPNIDALKPTVRTKGPTQKINLYKAHDGRSFLSSPAISPDSLDNAGLFHVMNFWTPKQILKALEDIHIRLKVGGALFITTPKNKAVITAKYAESAATEPWGCIYSHPFFSESYKYMDQGRKGGGIVTHLPAAAFAELLAASGFETLQASSYYDFYLGGTETDNTTYVGVYARKTGAPNKDLLAKWVAHADVCETIMNTDHSGILYNKSSVDLNKKNGDFRDEYDTRTETRKRILFASIKDRR